MSFKKLDSLCKRFAKEAHMAFLEESEHKAKRSIFLDYETGSPVCMLRMYKEIVYHPHVNASPVESAKHAVFLTTDKEKVNIGDVFYYDALAEDVYYGEDAIEAVYQDMKA